MRVSQFAYMENGRSLTGRQTGGSGACGLLMVALR